MIIFFKISFSLNIWIILLIKYFCCCSFPAKKLCVGYFVAVTFFGLVLNFSLKWYSIFIDAI